MTIGNETQITPPRVSLVDERTGAVSREWYRWFYSLFTTLGSGTGVVPVISGGTGLSTTPTNGQLLIGNSTGYTLNTLGYGAGISVTNGAGTIVVANTGVLSNIAGTGISVSGATGNVTIANTGVLSIIAGTGISASSTTGNVTLSNTGVLSWSGGTTGLTPATATTGAVTLAGKLVIANGGTNATATPTAGAISYGTGTAYAFTAAGTAGQVLTSAGASVPTWTTPVVNTVSAPVTKTANFTVADGEAWLINNKSGSTCTVTLPAAASWIGRQLIFKNMQAQAVNSASSNIVPIDSTTAGTAILLGVVGNWATMVSDGTNWIIMQAASNNNLLLE
jgi:hypothetical protein